MPVDVVQCPQRSDKSGILSKKIGTALHQVFEEDSEVKKNFKSNIPPPPKKLWHLHALSTRSGNAGKGDLMEDRVRGLSGVLVCEGRGGGKERKGPFQTL